MIETTIPEINVSELMAVVRARVAEMKKIEERVVLPPVAPIAAPPPAALPKPVDAKRGRLLEMLNIAREKTEAASWIPKPMRRFFRKQGGYNRILLDAVTMLTKTNAELADRVQQLAACIKVEQAWLNESHERSTAVETWRAAAAQILQTIPDRAAGLREEINGETERVAENLRREIGEVQHIVQTLRADGERSGKHIHNLQNEVDRSAAAEAVMRREIGKLDERSISEGSYVRAELSQHSVFLQRWINRRGESAAAPNETPPKMPGRLDAFYVGFEDRFRGARSEIKKRVEVYLPYLTNIGVGGVERPILDLGCGRGEWLELLQENQLTARGVDLNAIMIAQCEQRKLLVAHADAGAHLRSLPDSSIGAVTGFHIIEHLALETLMDIFAETWRVLTPGGVAIFESPNCKNVIVGACNFYSDPTHRNPVFPDTAEWMLHTHGFEPVKIEYLSPVEESPFAEDRPETALLNNWFFGPRDFAVIGYKPVVP